MFHDCNLVHADLSEYNLLWDKGQGRVWMIDVSQSVDADNPMAGEFLRMDCKNVVDFFRRHMDQRSIVSSRQLFDLITTTHVKSHGDDVEDYIEKLHASPDLGSDVDGDLLLQNTLPK